MLATVNEWRDNEGLGVLQADELAEGIWVHFSMIEMDGYKTLRVGERVDVDVEGPLSFSQDGFRFRAIAVRPLHAPPTSQAGG